MKIITWNVNGIRARYDEVVRLVGLERPDLVCLQEIKASPTQVPEPLTGLPDYWNLWHGAPGGYSGVSLHVRRGWRQATPVFSHPTFDLETRFVEVALDDLVVASVYVPNGQRNFPAKLTFLAGLADHARAHRAAGRRLVICGDLNVTRTDADVHPRQRKPGAIGQRDDERQLLEAVIAEDLVDIARARAPDDEGLFTWWPPWRDEKRKNRGWRIDYVLAATALAERASRCEVLVDYGTSDHAPVVVELG